MNLVKRNKKYSVVFRKMTDGVVKSKSIALGTEKKSTAERLATRLRHDVQEGKVNVFENFNFQEWLHPHPKLSQREVI
jgi:hypothetical protein